MQLTTLRARMRALAAAVVLVALCASWPLVGTLLAAAVVVLHAPLGRTLTARLAAVLLLWLAWSQFAYAIPWPDALPPRQAVAWTLIAVAVLCWRALRPGRPALPRVGGPAVALAVFVLVVAWWYLPWRGDADHVLDRMLLGWDNAGHFAMVEQLRSPDAAAAAAFSGYPRGYHALVASLMELGWGPPAGLDGELVAYTYACLTVMGASLVLLAACVLATPALRRRTVLLVPAAAALVTLLMQLEDASQVPYYGFGNFLEAAALAGAVALLPMSWTRRQDPLRWFLLGSAAAGILATWPLLLVFVAPVPFAVWLARRGDESGALRRLLTLLPLALPPVVLAVLAQPRATDAITSGAAGAADGPWAAVDQFLFLEGAIRTSAFGWPILFPLAGVAVPLAAVVVGRVRGTAGRRDPDLTWLWLSPLAGLASAAAMLAYEYARVGEPRYYGIKLLCATMLAGGSVGIAAGAALLDAVAPPPPRRAIAVPLALVAAVVLLVAAGAPVPLVLPLSPGAAVRADQASAGPELRRPLADAMRAACGVVRGHPGEYYLLVPGIDHEDAVRVNVWIVTCGLDWAGDHAQVLRTLIPDRREAGGPTLLDLPVDAARILAARPRARVIVPAAAERTTRAGLRPDQQDRLLTY